MKILKDYKLKQHKQILMQKAFEEGNMTLLNAITL